MPCEVPSGEAGEGRHGWSLLEGATVTPNGNSRESCAVVTTLEVVTARAAARDATLTPAWEGGRLDRTAMALL